MAATDTSFATLVSIASLASNLAVVLTVVYLALQNRQSARNQRAIMDRGRSQQVSDWLQFIAQPDIAPFVLRGHANYSSLTADERRHYRWCVYPLFLHYEDSFNQHNDGMISDRQWNSIRLQMKDTALEPGIAAVWKQVRELFADEFRRFADSLFAVPAGD